MSNNPFPRASGTPDSEVSIAKWRMGRRSGEYISHFLGERGGGDGVVDGDVGSDGGFLDG